MPLYLHARAGKSHGFNAVAFVLQSVDWCTGLRVHLIRRLWFTATAAGYISGWGCNQSGTTFSGNYGQLPSCSGATPHYPSSGKGVIMSYVSAVSPKVLIFCYLTRAQAGATLEGMAAIVGLLHFLANPESPTQPLQPNAVPPAR